MGKIEYAGVGTLVRAQGTGAAAGAALPPRLEPADFLLGRCSSRRSVPGLVWGALVPGFQVFPPLRYLPEMGIGGYSAYFDGGLESGCNGTRSTPDANRA